MELTTLKIKQKYKKQYQAGFPLLLKEAVANPHVLQEEGQLLEVVLEDGTFIGRGYYGEQNKGVGWILTQKEKEAVDEKLFEKKLMIALGRRSELLASEDTTAFRMLNGEGDGLGGLIIDYYDGYYLLQWYSAGIYSFKETIINLLLNSTDAKGIYEKKRFAEEGKYVEDEDFVTGEKAESPLLVKENGVTFAVYLNDGAMTGVFLDQREVRKTLKDKYSQGKTVLNTFSYTGAFSVFAALGGASHTTSIDAANRSKAKTEEQFRVNGLDPAAHRIIVDDVFAYYRRAAKREENYDIVILDPPSFARTKKTTFRASKDYGELIKQTLPITNSGGLIIASTNHAGLSKKKFLSFIDQAFKENGHEYEIKESYSLPEDFVTHSSFAEGNYLKVFFIKKLT
ncbi:class I SAM-dependent rRNA methyltransferase [Alkalicoccus daliensis]|uniref:23S rRNA (Cytosine1962-C5)-methyltransferase n=1 Tax=Alkalicoccus daliensis TaxID=745820 RepID=A0A1H0K6F4_9BACI|nr:class I SAM-dependent rRNA methyltransferase [Alkalicoccus daliensis]SDO51363.1 23S rRNA (cytosine1962-C5)-methyltransferase [Alkalicoccus daliensis]